MAPGPFLFSRPLHTPKEERHGKIQGCFQYQTGASEKKHEACEEAR